MSWLEDLTRRFSNKATVFPSPSKENIVVVDRDAITEICAYLKYESSPRFDFLMDLSAVDYLPRSPRFEVIYNLYSTEGRARLRLKVTVSEIEPVVPTICHLWSGTNWFEREVWDMFGIRFSGHPDLKRILMYDEFKGHPLRRDYPIQRRQPLITNTTTSEQSDSPQNGNGTFRIKKPPLPHNTETRLLNMGPAHPAMHGVIHLTLELDAERIVKADVEIGYLHRAFEKDSEAVTWGQVFPYTDRLNYVSPLINNVGYAMAVEKLLGLQTTERCQYIRVIMSEISRLTDHLTCVGANAMELGAMTAFLYLMKVRDILYGIVEEITGARLTVSYVRIGGVKSDLTAEFPDNIRAALKEVRSVLKETHKLLTRNRIFVDRMQGIGKVTQELAIDYGFTGPVLRSTGIDYDVRKAEPYLIYDQLDFDVPYGENGDNYDRYLCRMEEIEQSCHIIEQCLEKIPSGPVNVDLEGKIIPAEKMADLGKFGQTKGLLQVQALTDPTLSGGNSYLRKNIFPDDKRVVLPAKEKTYGSIEGLMNHFMLIMEGYGIQPPPCEAYQAVEGANGELGFYVVSNGSDRAHRVRVRPPCFTLMSGFHKMIEGDMVADIIATFGTVNMIAGELDR